MHRITKKLGVLMITLLSVLILVACDKTDVTAISISTFEAELSDVDNMFHVTFFLKDYNDEFIVDLTVDAEVVITDVNSTILYQETTDLVSDNFNFNKKVLILLNLDEIDGGYTNQGTVQLNIYKDSVLKDSVTIASEAIPCADKYQAIYDYFEAHGQIANSLDEDWADVTGYRITSTTQTYEFIFKVYDNGMIIIETEFTSESNGATYTNLLSFLYRETPSLAGELSLYYTCDCGSGYGTDRIFVFERDFVIQIVFDSPEFESVVERFALQDIAEQMSVDSLNAFRDFLSHSIGIIF